LKNYVNHQDLDTIEWQGQIGLWRPYEQGGRPKYDLVHRDRHGTVGNIFYGVSDWGLGLQWQQLINTYAPQLTVGSVTFDDRARGSTMPATSASHMAAHIANANHARIASFQGERRPRWRGRGAIARIWRDERNKPRFESYSSKIKQILNKTAMSSIYELSRVPRCDT
jgi:hypothetical protein